MTQSIVLFNGSGATGLAGLWLTDGTVLGTVELTVAGTDANFGLNPSDLLSLGPIALFAGHDANGQTGLWVTDGSGSGTTELAVAGVDPNSGLRPADMTRFGAGALFRGSDDSGIMGLWRTDGSGAGTVELTVAGAAMTGLRPSEMIVFQNTVLLNGVDTSGRANLWVSDGTGAGTVEILATGSDPDYGLVPAGMTVLGGRVLFRGDDTSHNSTLWTTDGTAAGTTELIVAGESQTGFDPTGLTVLGTIALFGGLDANGFYNLWVTDGTAAGTFELMAAGAALDGLRPDAITMFQGKVLFDGLDANGRYDLWQSDGTAAGTTVLNVAGAAPAGLTPSNLTVYGDKLLFAGSDANGRNNLWETDGTAAGTVELAVGGVNSNSGLAPRDLTVAAACYAEGTRIMTAAGEVPIERLRPGDGVIAVGPGRGGVAAVKWIGQRAIDLTRHPNPALAAPIRISAGALGENQPMRDLIVSPSHCLYLDGGLCPAQLLVNGMTIVRDADRKTVTWYHVELDRHAVVLAEGAAAESYLDTGNRSMFSNAGPSLMLHPDMSLDAVSGYAAAGACAPLLSAPDRVRPIWQRLAERAKLLGYSDPARGAVDGTGIELVVDGKRLLPVRIDDRTLSFVIPAGVKSTRLVSAATDLGLARPWAGDQRRVGVAISAIVLRGRTECAVIGADHPSLTDGWHAAERDRGTVWRWTNGDAALPVPPDGPYVVEIHAGDQARRGMNDARQAA